MSDGITIASVVEGHGEVQALPLLVRRIAHEILDVTRLHVAPPHRLKRDHMLAGDTLRRAVTMQSMRVRSAGGVPVLVDADDDCPVELSATIRRRAPSVPARVLVAVAVREFESWFLAAAPSLRGHRSVLPSAAYAADPEGRRDAKGELCGLMTEKYRETLHQPAFASLIDLHLACRSRSFRHLVDCVEQLVKTGA